MVDIKQRTIQQIELKKLKLNPKNPRKNNDAVDTVARSIEKFGFNVPLFCDTSLTVYCGNTRLKAARKLKLETVPCIIADDLTTDEIREYALIDNKSAELATWDVELLQAELAELDMSEWEIVDWATGIVSASEISIVEDEEPEVDETSEPVVKLGEIWQLGRHKLICGDSTDKTVVDSLMDGVKADMWLTDPPYNVALGRHDTPEQARQRHRRADGLLIMNDEMSEAEFLAFLEKSFSAALAVLKRGGPFYIWHADNSSLTFRLALKNVGATLRQTLIWNKGSITLGRQDYQWRHEPCLYGWKSGAAHNWYSDRKQPTVLDFPKPTVSKEHPTMKPVALIAYQIKNSTKQGDMVYDGFGGSGTTLIACEQLGRRCNMVEYDPRYCDVIIKRWQNLTGQTAVKLS